MYRSIWVWFFYIVLLWKQASIKLHYFGCPLYQCMPETSYYHASSFAWVVYLCYTANEGPVRIQYKCLVPIYAFPEMKLRGLAISKTELLCSVQHRGPQHGDHSTLPCNHGAQFSIGEGPQHGYHSPLPCNHGAQFSKGEGPQHGYHSTLPCENGA
jgi:hypothetical protein